MTTNTTETAVTTEMAHSQPPDDSDQEHANTAAIAQPVGAPTAQATHEPPSLPAADAPATGSSATEAPSTRIEDIVRPVEIEQISPEERAALTRIDTERRLRLLRIIAPGLLVVVTLAFPFAIQADMMAGSLTSVPQVSIGFIGAAIATWATFRRHVNVATLAFFLGITGVIVLLILQDGPLGGTGRLSLSGIIDFAELAIPIAVAGVLGSPRLALAATAFAVLFTLGDLLLTPHDPDLAQQLAQPNGLALFTIPLSTLIMLGLLLYAATSGYLRTQRELGAFRIAYARERELDRLKNQFISNVNHELRTPIMALQGYIELARAFDQPDQSESQQQMLTRGAETTSYLAGLVRAILNVRRIEDDAANMKPQAFALRPLIIRATNLIDPREGDEQRDLYLRMPEDLTVYADPDRVQQVMVNLLSNASKYSPAGSSIEITARRVMAIPPQAPGSRARRAGQARPQPMVEVAVRDHGLGIPPDQAPLLFQRFVRLERDIASQVMGTGLGLAICRAYIEAMGGRIWVESTGKSGEGSTFCFTLPLSPAQQTATQKAPHQEHLE